MNIPKPKTRSKLRIAAGKTVYTTLRHIKWITNKNYATNKSCVLLPYTVFEHSTPLVRNLQGLDMELQLNKVKNLKISIKRLDGVIVEPGESFSFWRLVGKPTKTKGYLDGLVLKTGGLSKGTGGGLCQLTNMIYWMCLHSPLDVIERYRHSYDVFPDSNRTQPFGSGATCVYNYRDLIVKNNTQQKFQMHFHMDEERLYGSLLSEYNTKSSYEIYEGRHWITQEFWGGYIRHNVICRKVFDCSGNISEDEVVTENHAAMMYQPFLE